MKKNIIRIVPLITPAVLSLLMLKCQAMQITGHNVKRELQRTAESIKKDKMSIYKLDSKTVGRKGYFYMITNDGKISHHPKKGLINSDFSRFHFVQRILKERNGCLSFDADGTRRYIFFSDAGGDDILCLAMDAGEFADPVYGCDSDLEEKK